MPSRQEVVGGMAQPDVSAVLYMMLSINSPFHIPKLAGLKLNLKLSLSAPVNEKT